MLIQTQCEKLTHEAKDRNGKTNDTQGSLLLVWKAEELSTVCGGGSITLSTLTKQFFTLISWSCSGTVVICVTGECT